MYIVFMTKKMKKLFQLGVSLSPLRPFDYPIERDDLDEASYILKPNKSSLK